MSDSLTLDLTKAWEWRERLQIFSQTQAVRVFHGPGEGRGDLQSFAVDRFGDHYWVTLWENQKTATKALSDSRIDRVYQEIIQFLKTKQAVSVVGMSRPEQGVPAEVVPLTGDAPRERFSIDEAGAQFWIQFQGTRHPGLFLDHLPLRQWLRANMRGMKVLNTFAYTGSLSIVSGLGGASSVTTLDLSKPVIQWAQENWRLNQLPESEGKFIYGDVFEWLPRLKKQGESFDCVILDPPSFSHGKVGKFSTAKDLGRLHALALDLLGKGGTLITSINSANITWEKYEKDLFSAAQEKKRKLQVIRQIDLPETFPTPFGQPMERYLKGWILKAD